MRKARFFIGIAAAIVVLVGAPALAFHDGGVAHCNGCHTMHNSEDGALVDADSPNGNPWLLRDATPSDVCLGCHATRSGAVLDPTAAELGGGNFSNLLLTNINDGYGGASNPITGDHGGHNLDAPGFSIGTDPTLSAAPGGTFPASVMGCTSCHDPHGTTDFRLLYGTGRLVQEFYTFTNPAPNAVGLGLRGAVESNASHTAYQGGMSAWCGNCHGDFHNNNTKLIHPSGSAIGATIATTYNLYNGSDDLTGGAAGTAYLAQVPFEDPANTTTSTTGPTASSQVACITCHRAHATSAPDAGRWDFDVTFLHEDGLESGSPALPNPYNYTQRSLCNKCHKKDEFDAILLDPNAPVVP